MKRSGHTCIACLLALLVTASAVRTAPGQGTITSLGSGVPQGITNETAGTYYVTGGGVLGSGAARWNLTGNALSAANIGGLSGGRVSANGAYMMGTVANNGSVAGVSVAVVNPPWSIPTEGFVAVPLPAGHDVAARYDMAAGTWQSLGGIPNDAYSQSYGCFGSGGAGTGATGADLTPHGISSTGRFIVGMSNISTYNSTGTAIAGNSTFRFRPWVWDAEANGGAGAMRLLPTPFRTTSQTQRRRDGTAWAVSTDGTVILGAQEHNLATSPTSTDPDGGRPVVWRWDGSDYVMTYLPNGINESGFPYTYAMSHGTMHMNADGTIIVGRAVSPDGVSFIGKWVWNSGTNSWDFPISIGSNLSTPASWLPAAVTSCSIPPTLDALGMSDDGSIVVGAARYSTCGSFMSGGWIWHSMDNLIVDWYDFLLAKNVPGIFDYYGPIGDGVPVDPTKGLCKLGFPSGISPNGNAIVGFQGGTQIIPDASPWIYIETGAPTCVDPIVTTHPNSTLSYSVCSSFILVARAAGTLPAMYQWYKDGLPLSEGPTGTGSTIVGATAMQLRITNPNPQDQGSYHCTMTGPCGGPVATTTASVATINVTALANDTCDTAQAIGDGTNVFSFAPCGAYYPDPILDASCATGTFADAWFSYTPSVTGDIRIETCGASYDTVVSVYDGCGGSELDCNDNYVTGPSTGCASTRSRITSLSVVQNQPILIRVAAKGFLSSTATGNISIIAAPAPAPNDSCENAAPAIVGANAFDTTEATNDATVSCSTAASRDVWFSFTPGGHGFLSAITCPGTTWNTVLSITDFQCAPDIACNDNIPSPAPAGCTTSQSRISDFEVFDDLTYYIRVGSNSPTTFGPGSLHLMFNPDGDMNCDGKIDGVDIQHFVQAVLDPAGYTADHDGSPFAPCNIVLGDVNADTLVDSNDVSNFIDLLLAE